ncbi:uncharacterized protein [Diabrotica undecimpunctata]|uniref:uncharacterized protein isoform X2 n=1 Tax=Diabrotica undecimpunctata TaxID=50387 RepID=UPI003B63E7EB
MTVQQYCLRWNNHQPNFISVFSSLLNSQSLVDVTLAAEGKQLQAHKVVLSACSSYFQSLFATNPCKHPIVILKDVKFTDLRVLVDFMYHGEVSVSQEQLPCILKTAEMLKIKGLTEIPMENPTVKCESQLSSERSEMSSQSTDHWSLEETRPISPSSPSTKRRRLKKNVICNPTITTEPPEVPPNEILLSTADVFETVLKPDEARSIADTSQKYNGIPIASIQPSTSHQTHQREAEPTHQIITQVTPPQDVTVNTSQSLDCSQVELSRTCTTSQPTTASFSPRSSPPPQEIQHMGPKRGRFLMRQSRIKREPDLCTEADLEAVGLSPYLSIPPVRIERQCSEPIPCISPSPDNLLHVPDHVLVKQHSHPLLPSKSAESSTRSSHCPVVRLGPALGCNFCWNTVDKHGRIIRRKTEYHCPECQTNLCIVPCFQEYHKTQAIGGATNLDPLLPSSSNKPYSKSS